MKITKECKHIWEVTPDEICIIREALNYATTSPPDWFDSDDKKQVTALLSDMERTYG